MSELVATFRAQAGFPARPERLASPPQDQAVAVPDPVDAAPPGSSEADARPAPSLSSLLAQARVAGATLAAQPLPIANRDMLLLQKLFGG